jgi:hypothetical protein
MAAGSVSGSCSACCEHEDCRKCYQCSQFHGKFSYFISNNFRIFATYWCLQ